MAKIKISGVGYDQSNYTVMVTLVETRTEEGKEVETPIGEAAVRFPLGTEMADIKYKIVDAAEGIMDAHKNALDKRRDIEELDFPEIT